VKVEGDADGLFNGVPDAFRQFIEIRNSPGKGRGVFITVCSHSISRPQRSLGVFTGRFIDATTIPHLTNDQTAYVLQLSSSLAIDGQSDYWTGIINHSYLPNVKILKSGRIIQIRQLHAGQELLVNYGSQYWATRTPPLP
jgi:hypothetical protein